jgi:hypothetical protein
MSAQLAPVPAEAEIYLVRPDGIPAEWPLIDDLLTPAVERSNGRWSMPALLHSLCLGDHHLWIVREQNKPVAAAATQFVDYPHQRMLSVQFLGGTGFDEWGDQLLDTFERFGRDAGCNGLEAVARFGFWPFFKKHGYARSYCTYEKDLEDT